mmetsp:Transcript_13956/g.44838  ORF Transcript_13956/g.44838 Transcript_13956/m.44838 type:complete len:105 (-) Transcript_13956:592-906(-)
MVGGSHSTVLTGVAGMSGFLLALLVSLGASYVGEGHGQPAPRFCGVRGNLWPRAVDATSPAQARLWASYDTLRISGPWERHAQMDCSISHLPSLPISPHLSRPS